MRGSAGAAYLSYNLRRFRHELGWSQTELATRSKFTQQYISALERGLQPGAPEHVDVLANVLGVKVAALLKRPRRSAAFIRGLSPEQQPSRCP
jgi:transcriptional regulator with XRE-family HTH domain